MDSVAARVALASVHASSCSQLMVIVRVNLVLGWIKQRLRTACAFVRSHLSKTTPFPGKRSRGGAQQNRQHFLLL